MNRDNKDKLKAIGVVVAITIGAIPFISNGVKERSRQRNLDELIETKTSQIIHYDSLPQADIVVRYDLNKNGILDHEEARRLFTDYDLIERQKQASYVPK